MKAHEIAYGQRLLRGQAPSYERLQARLAGGGVHRNGDAGDIAVPLGNQILHGLEGGFLLFEEHAAFAGLRHIAVNHHQRHGDRLNQRHDLLFAHVAGIENDCVALAVGEHLHRFFFAFRSIVAVGDD